MHTRRNTQPVKVCIGDLRANKVSLGTGQTYIDAAESPSANMNLFTGKITTIN